jgi:hypothetical protein
MEKVAKLPYTGGDKKFDFTNKKYFFYLCTFFSNEKRTFFIKDAKWKK